MVFLFSEKLKQRLIKYIKNRYNVCVTSNQAEEYLRHLATHYKLWSTNGSEYEYPEPLAEHLIHTSRCSFCSPKGQKKHLEDDGVVILDIKHT